MSRNNAAVQPNEAYPYEAQPYEQQAQYPFEAQQPMMPYGYGGYSAPMQPQTPCENFYEMQIPGYMPYSPYAAEQPTVPPDVWSPMAYPPVAPGGYDPSFSQDAYGYMPQPDMNGYAAPVMTTADKEAFGYPQGEILQPPYMQEDEAEEEYDGDDGNGKQRHPLPGIIATVLCIGLICAAAAVFAAFIRDYADNDRKALEYRSKNNLHSLYDGAVRSANEQALMFPQAVSTEALPMTETEDGNAAEMQEPIRTKQFVYPKNTVNNINPELFEMQKENADIIGKLRIDGVLQEIIVQSDNRSYYLSHDAAKNKSTGGAVTADAACGIRQPPENLILRGISSVSGKGFEPLMRFADIGQSFAYSASTAVLTTLYEEEPFYLFAVIKAGAAPEMSNYLDYASHPSFASDEEFMQYVSKCRSLSLYNFAVDVQPGDRLLTLATISLNSTSDGELVLVYRMAREGEY